MSVLRRIPTACYKITPYVLQRQDSRNTAGLLDTVSTRPVSQISANVAPDVLTTAVSSIPELATYSWLGTPLWAYQSLLEYVHLTTGLPWVGVLVGAGLCVRLCYTPCIVWMERNMVAGAPVLAKITECQQDARKAKVRGDLNTAYIKAQEIRSIIKKENYKGPFRWMIPNIGLSMLGFFSIRGMTEMHYQPFLDTSLGWIPNLCASDPYFILPAANALLLTYILKSGTESTSNNMAKFLSNPIAFYGFAGIMGVFMSWFPTAMVLYWLSSTVVCGVVITPLLRHDPFRLRIGLTTMEEKRAAMSLMPTLESSLQQSTDMYQTVRKTRHEEDMEFRKKRAESLPHLDISELEELYDELDSKKAELEGVREKLSRELEETSSLLLSSKLEYLKTRHEEDMEFRKKRAASLPDSDTSEVEELKDELDSKKAELERVRELFFLVEKLSRKLEETEKDLESLKFRPPMSKTDDDSQRGDDDTERTLILEKSDNKKKELFFEDMNKAIQESEKELDSAKERKRESKS